MIFFKCNHKINGENKFYSSGSLENFHFDYIKSIENKTLFSVITNLKEISHKDGVVFLVSTKDNESWETEFTCDTETNLKHSVWNLMSYLPAKEPDFPSLLVPEEYKLTQPLKYKEEKTKKTPYYNKNRPF